MRVGDKGGFESGPVNSGQGGGGGNDPVAQFQARARDIDQMQDTMEKVGKYESLMSDIQAEMEKEKKKPGGGNKDTIEQLSNLYTDLATKKSFAFARAFASNKGNGGSGGGGSGDKAGGQAVPSE